MGNEVSLIIFVILKKIQDGGGGHFGFQKNVPKFRMSTQARFLQRDFLYHYQVSN